MPGRELGFVRDGNGNVTGIFMEVIDDAGDVARFEFVPTDNGKMEIAVTTKDGVSKRGEIEPGAAGGAGTGV